MSKTPILISIPFSPWSEKARWALDHHGIAYTKETYAPIIGELGLRRRLGRWTGKVTVPVLFVDDLIFDDSALIAKYAEEHGQGSSLFGADKIDVWMADAEAALDATRALNFDGLLSSEEACLTMVPKNVKQILPKSVALSLVKLGIKRTQNKYAGSTTAEYSQRRQDFLERMSAQLRGESFLCGTFSYADIVAVQVLNLSCPVENMGGLRYRPAYRESTFDHDVASKFPDLLQWRDTLIENHRQRD